MSSLQLLIHSAKEVIVLRRNCGSCADMNSLELSELIEQSWSRIRSSRRCDGDEVQEIGDDVLDQDSTAATALNWLAARLIPSLRPPSPKTAALNGNEPVEQAEAEGDDDLTAEAASIV